MADAETRHRPGVLIVDTQKIALVDLDAGSVRPIAVESLLDADHPELRAIVGHSIPEAVTALDIAECPSPDEVDPTVPHVVWEPVALRVDSGRVLAWDAGAGAHVALTGQHLDLLDRLRSPLTVEQLEATTGAPAIAEAVAQLLRLHLVRAVGADEIKASPAAPEVASATHPQSSGDAVSEADRPLAPEDDGSEPDGVPVSLVSGAAASARSWLRRRTSRDHATEDLTPTAPDLGSAEAAHRSDDRVPVIPLYHFAEIVSTEADDLIEPSLSIGILFAHVRNVDEGRLNERYDLHRLVPDPEAAFEAWAADPVPAIFVFSDYIWNCDRHLALSERVKQLSPDSLCLHGGPSSPKYEADTVKFFEDNPAIDVAARGEGEHIFADLLTALNGGFDADAVDRLAAVEGITFRRRGDAAGEIVRTPDRDRPTDLDEFPSPYLTGEFDDLLERGWVSASIETNRGCPYGCTFCDWGSATMSRIRKFDLERVKAELDWIAAKAPTGMVLVSDANFGIFSRDVEIVEHMVELKQRHPDLSNVIFAGIAKNTTKYTSEIYKKLTAAGLTNLSSSLAIQTADEGVLAIINRKNIKLERYEELAESFAELSMPMMTDILFGLPGSTVETFKNDLQHCFDREVTARVFPLIMLPNSPMNAPDYRERYQIRVDDEGMVVATSTFDEAEFERMEWLRLIFRASDHFGILRHLLRHLQWERGIRALDVVDLIDRTIRERGNAYPLLAFYGRLIDLYTMPPVAWRPFFDEVLDLLRSTYGIEMDSALGAMVELQLALAPERGRQFPHTVTIEHDLLAYRADRLAASKGNGAEVRPLVSYGPLEFTVNDPADICSTRIQRNDFLVRRQMESGNLFWIGLDWDLDSPFARPLFTNAYLFADKVPG